MTLIMSIILSFEFLFIEAIILFLVARMGFPKAKIKFDYLWREPKMKMYKPEQGADLRRLHRSDPEITIWWPMAEQLLKLVSTAIFVSFVTGIVINILRTMYNIVQVALTANYASIGENPMQMLGWFVGITPIHVWISTILIAIVILPSPLLYWRLRWIWIYNFTVLWDCIIQDQELDGKWKALLTGTPIVSKVKDSDTPIAQLREVKSASNPADLGFKEKALEPRKKKDGTVTLFEKVRFQAFEWWIGRLGPKNGTYNLTLLSIARGGGDLLEWLFESKDFAYACMDAVKYWSIMDRRIAEIRSAGLKHGVGDMGEAEWSISTATKAEAEAQRRINQLFPVLWETEIDIFELASQHPDKSVVVFEPRGPANVGDIVEEEQILDAFETVS